MDDILFRMLLGHFIGDYFLQNNWMALNKKKNLLPLFTHCVLYTLAVCLFTPEVSSNVAWWVVVFCSHIIIDGTNIVDYYLQSVSGRSLKNLKKADVTTITGASYVSITWFVQIVADNTLHILLMYIGLKWLYP